ncbi:MAG: PAS domain S-box protein [Clostridiales bacterium]
MIKKNETFRSKKLREVLETSEEKFRSTLDNMMEGCAILDYNWNYIYVNDVNAKHAHLKKEDMIGKNMLELIPGVDKSPFFETYKKCMLEQKAQQMEMNFTFADGSTAWYEVKVTPVPEGIFVLSADVTKRKQTEESLKKALQQLTFHVENSPLALVEFDSDYRVIQWSKNAEKIFGWTAGEVLGKRIGDLKWVYEEDVRKVDNLSADMFASETTSNVNVNRNYRKDGSVITCEWYNSALVDSDGQLVSVFSLVLDITQRKKAEEELKQTLEALKRSNSDLEQFAYAASHDLQEPLRMISNYTGLLQRHLKGSLDEKSLQFMEFIVDGSKRMNLLIQGLLSYSRITSKKDKFTSVDLNLVLKDVLKDLQFAIFESKAQIEIEEMPSVKADPIQMKQLFQNLISNAIKFRGKEDPCIKVGVKVSNKEYIFSVKDNGIGISPDYFKKVFVIFQRLHSHSVYPGAGIGLAICKRIVEHHSGSIWIESEEGKGTSFYFSIPE